MTELDHELGEPPEERVCGMPCEVCRQPISSGMPQVADVSHPTRPLHYHQSCYRETHPEDREHWVLR